ncbi:MAG: serine hydrolase domain-containing protein [Caulobacterales bacterium]
MQSPTVRLFAALGATAALLAGGLGVAAPEWPTAAPSAVGADPAPLERLPAAIEHGDYPKTTSVLVVYRGQLIYERYFEGGGADVLNDTRSATKSITSLAVGAAIADGAIPAVTSPAFAFLKDRAPFANASPLKDAVTIEDLLTMSSALDCDDDVDASPGNEDRMHEQSDWTRWAVDLPLKADWRRDGEGRGPFSYCTAGAVLLGQILQRAERTPVDRFIEARILSPLGVSRGDWPRSPTGEVMTGGGLRLRSRDLAKLAWMMVDGGTWQGRRVIGADWLTAATTIHRHVRPGADYGYLYWRTEYAGRCGPVEGWYMAGNGGNAIVALKSLGTAVVVTRRAYNTHGMHEATKDLIERYVLPALPCAPAAS